MRLTTKRQERISGVPLSLWPRGPERPSVDPGEVHVWLAPLDVGAPVISRLEGILSPDERARADRFHFQQHRERFVVARGWLRMLLARYLVTSARRIRFRYECVCGNSACNVSRRKPALASELRRDSLGFNLSHSEGMVAYAITRGRSVGVDLERICPELAGQLLGWDGFTPREVVEVQALPPHLAPQAVFRYWTRKEAYLKATGGGLTRPVPELEAPGSCIRDLPVGPDYAGALAVEGNGCRPRLWRWFDPDA